MHLLRLAAKVAQTNGGGMSVLKRNNVQVQGEGVKAMIFAHGFGCDQNMWRLVCRPSEKVQDRLLRPCRCRRLRPVGVYPDKYGSLEGYAEDVLDICRGLDLKRVVFVGHSVSAMIGILAAIKAPELFSTDPHRPVPAVHQ